MTKFISMLVVISIVTCVLVWRLSSFLYGKYKNKPVELGVGAPTLFEDIGHPTRTVKVVHIENESWIVYLYLTAGWSPIIDERTKETFIFTNKHEAVSNGCALLSNLGYPILGYEIIEDLNDDTSDSSIRRNRTDPSLRSIPILSDATPQRSRKSLRSL